MTTRFWIVGLVLVLGARGLVAQDQLPGPQASRLKVGLDSLAIFLIRGSDTVPTGMLWDRLTIDTVGGLAVMKRVYLSRDEVLGSRLDTIVDTYPGLRPVSYRSRTVRGGEFLDFSPGDVTGWLRLANGDSVALEVDPSSAPHGEA